MLADKAFPDLQEEARDRLSLNRYMDQITDPQINFVVKQRRPKTLEAAVTATLEQESYRMPTTARVSQVAMEHTLDITDGEEEGSSHIGAVGKRSISASSDITGVLQTIMQRLERLENPGGQDKAPQPKTRRDPVIC